MLYLANPTTPAVRAVMTCGFLGAIMSPRQGNRLPEQTLFAIDNNCGPRKNGMPGNGYPGDERYLGLVQNLIQADGADLCDPESSSCLFAAGPDVVADARATLRRSYMLAWIRHAGFPAALVAQDGLEDLTVPWDDFDALFIGGSTTWKLGPAARDLAREASQRGKWVHMGRVNSFKRLQYADSIGCDSADGTYLTYAPGANLPRLLGWLNRLHDQRTRREAA